MKTGDLAKLFGVSDKTIRQWATEFSSFFSESKTKIRTYTEEDIVILATIAKYSHRGESYTTIRDRLESGERVDKPSEVTYGADMRMVPAAAVEQMIDATEIRMQLERMTVERDKLLELLQDRDGVIKNKELTIEQLYAQVDQLRNELTKLNREIGRLEGRLEEIDKR